MLADGEIRVPGAGDTLVDGDAVAALDAEPPGGGHGGGVFTGRGHQTGIERDRR